VGHLYLVGRTASAQLGAMTGVVCRFGFCGCVCIRWEKYGFSHLGCVSGGGGLLSAFVGGGQDCVGGGVGDRKEAIAIV